MSLRYSICNSCQAQFSYENKGRVRVFCSIDCYRIEQRKNKYTKEKKTIDRNDFIEKAKIKHDGKYTYIINGDLLSNSYVSVVCSQHGVFEQKIHSHLKGHGCRKCGFESASVAQSQGYEYFKKKSKLIHKDKYEYLDQFDYKNRSTVIDIICKKHGVFKQSASGHLSGKGCRKCGIERSSGLWNADKYEDICNKHSSGLSNIYIIKCFNDNEVFYKIGITKRKRVKDRFRGKLNMPYGFEVIANASGEARFIFNLEKQIHKILKETKYKPNIKFAGYTECFLSVGGEVIDLIKSIGSSSQINLI